MTRTIAILEASVSSNAPPLKRPAIVPANTARAIAARTEKNPIVTKLVRKRLRKVLLSPAAAAAERAGNAASAKARPTTLSAVLWKSWAYETEVIEPGARTEAI